MAIRKTDNSGRIFKAIREATKKELLVGVPGDAAPRARLPGEKGTPPSNVLVGYVMEFGDDEKHIPARPFLLPGVAAVKGEISEMLFKGIQGLFLGKASSYEKALSQAGLAAVVSVKAKMQSGPYAPLSVSTIEARARRRNPETGKLVGAKSNRDARNFLKLQGQGTPDDVLHEAGLAQPLLDTRSLYGSITYVIRTKGS